MQEAISTFYLRYHRNLVSSSRVVSNQNIDFHSFFHEFRFEIFYFYRASQKEMQARTGDADTQQFANVNE